MTTHLTHGLDLALHADGWTRTLSQDGQVTYLRSDHPLTPPEAATSPALLATHPGRLAAVSVAVGLTPATSPGPNGTREAEASDGVGHPAATGQSPDPAAGTQAASREAGETVTVTLAADRLRSWPLLWTVLDGGARLLVTDDPAVLPESLPSPSLHAPALAELADAGFVTGARTLLTGVHQVPQGATVTLTRVGGVWQAPAERTYGFFRYADPAHQVSDPAELSTAFLAALDATMTRMLERTQGRRLVLPLSGGLDSRLLLGWLALHGELGRVVTFTYGVPGAREVEVSRAVAGQVGADWHAVPYERAALLEHWHSPATAAFLSDAHVWSALPHVQDWYALSVLRDQGTVREGDVLLPGHTVVGNMHDDWLLGRAPVSRALAAHTVIRYHHNLQGAPARAWQDPWVAAPIRQAMELAGFDGSAETVCTFLEAYNLRERQTKYINNSVRAYEHLGMDWALPMLDTEVWDTWARGSAELTVTRDLYRQIINDLWATATGTASQQATAGGSGAGAASAPAQGYYQVTQVAPATRDLLKSVLRTTGLLPAAERTFSAWSSLHSSMAFDALFTDVSRPRAAVELLAGRKTLGFWTRSFLADTWCRSARIFSDLPVTPA